MRAHQHIGLLLSIILLYLPHTHPHITLILLKSLLRNLIQPDRRLIRILDQYVLRIGRRISHHHVDEGADDGPAVVEVQVHLGGKFAWFVAQHAQDDVVGGVLWGGAGDETVRRDLVGGLGQREVDNLPKFHKICLCENGLDGPSREFAGIVLHLRRHYCTTLAGQLTSPIKCATGSLSLIVELVERFDG